MATVHNVDVQPTAEQASNSALINAKRNFRYLWDPSTPGTQPNQFRTRALLRSLRFIGLFIFWRVFKYAKYAAIGAAAAAISATALGSVFSGVAFVAAPPTFAASIGLGLVWAVGKWTFHKASKRVGKVHSEEVDGIRPVQPVPEPKVAMNRFS